MDIQLTITPDERDALRAVLDYTVSGNPSGPRRHIISLTAKLDAAGADKYRFDVDAGLSPGTVYFESSES